jgi:hypothetical protein
LQLLEPQVLAACATALIVCSVLALIVSFIVRYFSLTRKDFRLLLFVLLAFSLLGFVTGQIMGQSREPAVMAVLPVVLTLLGGIVIYLVGAKGIQTQAIVASMVCCFAIALLIGVHFGGPARAFWRSSNVRRTVASSSDLFYPRGRPSMSPILPVRPQASAARLGRACSHVRSRSHRRARECGFPGSGPCETSFGADDGAFLISHHN